MDSTVFDIPIDDLKGLLLNKDLNVKKQCFQYIMLLTGEPNRCKVLYDNSEVLLEIIKAARSDAGISKLALNSLINVSSIEEGATAIFESDLKNERESKSSLDLLNITIDTKNFLAEHAANVLTNMTTWETLASKMAQTFISAETSFNLVFEAVYNVRYNPKCPHLSQHLCQLVGNLAQSVDFQKYLLTAEEGRLFCSILPLLNRGETTLQKRGIAATIYNCLFNSENHLLLLNPPFNILSEILLPIAGPEEFDEEDSEKLPIELQYLESDKQREPDTDLRKLMLQSLLMLCDTKNGRIFLRNHNAYVILREYHKWEKDASLILACENVVDILIRTEEEIGLENFRSVDVPDDLKEKFDKVDADFIQVTSKS